MSAAAPVAVLIVSVPDLHAVLCRDKDDCIGLQLNRSPEENSALEVHFLNLDMVRLRHLQENP